MTSTCSFGADMQATIWKYLLRGVLKYSSVIGQFSDMVVSIQKILNETVTAIFEEE